MSLLQKAADRKYTAAQYELGRLYGNGEFVEQNLDLFIRLIALAANQGNKSAMNNLGEIYENGEGVPANHTQSVEWYRKGAQLGDDDCQSALKRLGEST